MSERKISVLIKEPGKEPRHVNISDKLENLQKIVEGYIQIVPIATDAVLICNEEGKLMGLPHCCRLMGEELVGTIILAGTEGEELADLPGNWEIWKKLFRSLWEEV